MPWCDRSPIPSYFRWPAKWRGFSFAFKDRDKSQLATWVNYIEWFKGCPWIKSELISFGLIPGDISLSLMVDGKKIGVVGLNSAFLQLTGGNYYERLLLDTRQFHAVCNGDGAQWVKQHNTSLILTHHPRNWLNNRSQEKDVAEILPAGRFAVHMFGHMHEPLLSSQSVAGGPSLRSWQGCSLFGLEYYGEDEKEIRTHGYSSGQIEFQGHLGHIRMWPRISIYDQVNGWRIIPNNQFVLEDDTGTKAEPFDMVQLGSTVDSNPKVVEISKPQTNKTSTSIPVISSEYGRPFRPYGSDLRPVVDAWVGREQELLSLSEMSRGVAVITGIGGQGKSTLVAKFLETWTKLHPESFTDWRDCREEGERFVPQLVSLIENLTDGVVTGEHLSGADGKVIVRYFFELVGDRTGVIVLDNIDSYVNQADATFSLLVDVFVQEALRVQHNILIILTCRPRITYASPRFLEISLNGIDLSEAIELFRLRAVKKNQADNDEIEEIWSRTDGHPLWLNLIAVQISRNQQAAPYIIGELRKGHVDDRTRAMFKALWKGINSHQKTILRCMAEVTYPETKDSLHMIVGSLIRNYNQFNKAFESLKSLSLIVERGSERAERKYDLHPLVRHYIRTEFPTQQDRLPYIQPILLFLARLITGRAAPDVDASLEDLQRWTAKAELELASKEPVKALETLSRAQDRLIARNYHEEFFRVAKMIVEELDWQSIAIQDLPSFHNVVESLIEALTEKGREDEARQYLKRYGDNGGDSTVARLRFLNAASYLEWFVGNYDQAISYGTEAVDLKSQAGIDTIQDVSNTLALALRDAGKLDEALKIFAPDETLDDILSEDHRTSGKSSSYYGNVGRCLYLKGEIQLALQCFVNSAELLQDGSAAVDFLNSGYAALWIGEVLEQLNDYNTAFIFYKQAVNIWRERAPHRAAVPLAKIDNIRQYVTSNLLLASNDEVDRLCKKWLVNFQKSQRRKFKS